MHVRRRGRTAHTANGLVRHRDAALSEELFDVAQAQAEAMVSPHGMTDDGRRETVTSIPGLQRSIVHGRREVDCTVGVVLRRPAPCHAPTHPCPCQDPGRSHTAGRSAGMAYRLMREQEHLRKSVTLLALGSSLVTAGCQRTRFPLNGILAYTLDTPPRASPSGRSSAVPAGIIHPTTLPAPRTSAAQPPRHLEGSRQRGTSSGALHGAPDDQCPRLTWQRSQLGSPEPRPV